MAAGERVIGISLLNLVPGAIGGQERYIRRLVDGMQREFSEECVILYVCREAASLWPELPAQWRLKRLPIRGGDRVRRILYEQLILPFHFKRDGVGVSVHPSYTAPLGPGADKRMVSILDAQLAHVPEDFGWLERLAWRVFVPAAARRADCVVAVSKAAAKQVSAAYRLDEGRVHGVLLGVDPFFCPGPSEEREGGSVEGLAPFILAVGDTYPHKNFDTLVRAFGEEIAPRDPDLRLVLVGRARRGEAAIEAARGATGLGSRLVRMQGISDERLRGLYRSCRVFVMPSLYEGFGLPLIEAMACGAPAICHDLPALREVGGKAGCYLDAREPSALAEAILFLVHDDELRQRMSREGVLRAAEFQWERTVAQHARLLRALFSHQPEV